MRQTLEDEAKLNLPITSETPLHLNIINVYDKEPIWNDSLKVSFQAYRNLHLDNIKQKVEKFTIIMSFIIISYSVIQFPGFVPSSFPGYDPKSG